MSHNISERILELANRWLDYAEEDLPSEPTGETPEELTAIVHAAKQEWLDAQSYFNNATEPELVDHAILSLQAAERKYMYWLKRMKNSK
ncbi:MAG: DUF2508 family protein [Firmicutes bacterium]|nr:DUF2508 family protein [Bacillota bacterium]